MSAEDITQFHNEAMNKLDYFILGATLAICGYLAQTNHYGRIGLNEETLLLGSLLIFAGSAIMGFKRIESGIAIVRQNAYALQVPHQEIRRLLIDELKNDRTGHRYYVARNYLLLAGLACYLATKVWAAY